MHDRCPLPYQVVCVGRAVPIHAAEDERPCFPCRHMLRVQGDDPVEILLRLVVPLLVYEHKRPVQAAHDAAAAQTDAGAKVGDRKRVVAQLGVRHASEMQRHKRLWFGLHRLAVILDRLAPLLVQGVLPPEVQINDVFGPFKVRREHAQWWLEAVGADGAVVGEGFRCFRGLQRKKKVEPRRVRKTGRREGRMEGRKEGRKEEGRKEEGKN